MPPERSRRTLLETLGALGVVGLAGCAGESGPSVPTDTTARDPTTAPSTATATPRTEQTTSSGTETTQPTETTGSDPGTTVEDDGFEPPDLDDVRAPSAGVADAPLPGDPGQHKYATMGRDDAPVSVTLYGGWKCPYTRLFVRQLLGRFVDEYVESGRVQVRFRAVAYRGGEPFHGPDEPRAARAGLAVWYNDPAAYWSYFSYMFANQRGADGWADRDLLVGMAATAGVDALQRIDGAVESGAFASPVRQTMDAVERVPIERIPRFTVEGRDGSVPANYPDRVASAIRAARQ